jgi:hypothetical protein
MNGYVQWRTEFVGEKERKYRKKDKRSERTTTTPEE